MNRTERAIELLNGIISDIPDNDISTEAILYSCRELATLLKLDEKESEWINHELSGFKSEVPVHRRVTLPATVSRPEFVDPWNAVWDYWQSMLGSWKNITFGIEYPISQLETATRSIQLVYAEPHKVPRRNDDYSSTSPTINAEIPWIAELKVESMKAIASRIRSKAHEFVLKHREMVWIDESVHDDVIVDPTVFAGISSTGYFERLAEAVNKCYRVGVYTGSGVLLRKLIENLLYIVLEKAYSGTEKMDLIYNNNRKMIQGFSFLIDVFNKNYNEDFHRAGKISKKVGIMKIITNLHEMKDSLDMAAHNLPSFLGVEELKQIAAKADEISRFLRGVWDALP